MLYHALKKTFSLSRHPFTRVSLSALLSLSLELLVVASSSIPLLSHIPFPPSRVAIFTFSMVVYLPRARKLANLWLDLAIWVGLSP